MFSHAGGDTKRKGLPKWLKEELDKIEMKRQKTLQKEAEQLSRRGREGEGDRPAWRDEESDPEEEEEPVKVQSMPTSGFDNYNKSLSPDGYMYVSSPLYSACGHCVCVEWPEMWCVW